MSAAPVLLILGAGPNIGAHVAKAFAAKGYKVALASRSEKAVDGDQFHITVDLAKPENVAGVFEKVKTKLGAAPSVVVYNAALRTNEDPADPLSQYSLESHEKAFTINHTSVLAALQQTVIGFRSLPDSASKTFIFTGNILNNKTVPGTITFGASKGATAYAIRHLVDNKTYEKDGVRFYYADERTATGNSVGREVSGTAAAEEYLRLAEAKEQGPWLNTFVKGQGYVKF